MTSIEPENQFPRGSEWRQWDLHIHTPASFHWNGQRFSSDSHTPLNTQLVDQMIEALNTSEPTVFALMDYWTFDGWFALQKRLREPGAPQLKKLVFPGIELRLKAPANYRLNAHVVFSNEVSAQVLNDFRSALLVELIERPLSEECLVELARKVGVDKLKHHGFEKAQVDSDPALALRAGSIIAELNPDSYRTAIRKVPAGKAIGFMPFDTSDGLSDVNWREHYAFCTNLFKSSLIFESRDPDLWGAFVNETTPGNQKWIKNFQAALDNVPRLVVSGSDAHRFKGVSGDNNNRGYGDFPSGKATWLKADPSFQGLLQAILEPARRSYIGARPPKLIDVEENKTFYIDTVAVEKLASGPTLGPWLDGCKLPLNPDLVAIIGNKGSGKSALADVLALLGNSRQRAHLSFLKKERFRGKAGEPAKHFVGELVWKHGGRERRNLNEDPAPEKVEMVRYIPQGHFEEVCNDHVSGHSNAFERELRGVIFAHADETIRLGALDFDQIIEQQELGLRDRLAESRGRLKRLNVEIAQIESQLQPDKRSSLVELLVLKRQQIEEHQKIRPPEPKEPTDKLDEDQIEAARELEKIAAQLAVIEMNSSERVTSLALIAKKRQAVQNLSERLRQLERSYKQFEVDAAKDLELLGLETKTIAALTIQRELLQGVSTTIDAEQEALSTAVARDVNAKAELESQRIAHQNKLNGPQLTYQRSLKEMQGWAEKLNALIGTPEPSETRRGLETRISQIDELPARLAERKAQRLKIAADIFDILDEQRQARGKLFKPVQDLIQGNRFIREDYKLQFQAMLSASVETLAESLFALIKQTSAEFRGEDGFTAIRAIADAHDLDLREGMVEFVNQLEEKVARAAASSVPGSVGITTLLRKDKLASDVYDVLFGLSFLEPRYSLLFQDTPIQQLSPGQRGALLLIFYLLVDTGRNPIILDQPEENLDNQTVVSLLVPVLTEAKKQRQIIMVTHNPNLAVVCDAEQVIYSRFDRKGGPKITYTAGAIENPVINLHLVNVLEGTKRAFDNRRSKYH